MPTASTLFGSIGSPALDILGCVVHVSGKVLDQYQGSSFEPDQTMLQLVNVEALLAVQNGETTLMNITCTDGLSLHRIQHEGTRAVYLGRGHARGLAVAALPYGVIALMFGPSVPVTSALSTLDQLFHTAASNTPSI
eukprot:m.13245 g.13245  ORF g.13245 m.13245 type:complete len:137 (+) comp5923_c0_seq1:73-483(+)